MACRITFTTSVCSTMSSTFLGRLRKRKYSWRGDRNFWAKKGRSERGRRWSLTTAPLRFLFFVKIGHGVISSREGREVNAAGTLTISPPMASGPSCRPWPGRSTVSWPPLGRPASRFSGKRASLRSIRPHAGFPQAFPPIRRHLPLNSCDIGFVRSQPGEGGSWQGCKHRPIHFVCDCVLDISLPKICSEYLNAVYICTFVI